MIVKNGVINKNVVEHCLKQCKIVNVYLSM